MRLLYWILPGLLLLFTCKTSTKSTKEAEATTTTPINLCGPTVADLNTAPGNDGHLSPLYDGLDVYHYPVSTKSELAQKYFDQGFILNYGFNHSEAARSFREVVRLDPECAMGYWGIAYVLGPNYNAPMSKELLGPANEAVNNAKMYLYNSTPKEKGLIEALSKRYPKNADEDPMPYYEAYADAMRELARKFPDDIDIQAMTAESLMNLHPWDMFSKSGEPRPWTPEILSLIETALEKSPDHPQAMHLYIHAMESSPNPEKALEVAHRLRFRVPGAGHLVHMPAHLYINTGHYHEGVLANERAVLIDSAYIETCHDAGIYPMSYYPHNWHFLAACAALEGNGKRALEASRYMADYVVDRNLMYESDWVTLQHFYMIPVYIMVKFANWEAIKNEPAPDPELQYPTAVWHYAQGMASAAGNDFNEAQGHLSKIKTIKLDTTLKDMTVAGINNFADLVFIAEHVLEGEIAHRMGDYPRLSTSSKKRLSEKTNWLTTSHPIGSFPFAIFWAMYS
jgi:tetratricopeptide (TPR) repeat protein